MGGCAVQGESRIFWNGARSFTVVVLELPLDLKVRAAMAAACVVNGHVCSLVGGVFRLLYNYFLSHLKSRPFFLWFLVSNLPSGKMLLTMHFLGIIINCVL